MIESTIRKIRIMAAMEMTITLSILKQGREKDKAGPWDFFETCSIK